MNGFSILGEAYLCREQKTGALCLIYDDRTQNNRRALWTNLVRLVYIDATVNIIDFNISFKRKGFDSIYLEYSSWYDGLIVLVTGGREGISYVIYYLYIKPLSYP